MLDKLAVLNHTLNGKKMKLHPKSLFTKKDKSGRQVFKNVKVHPFSFSLLQT